jgi:hypothetical protein
MATFTPETKAFFFILSSFHWKAQEERYLSSKRKALNSNLYPQVRRTLFDLRFESGLFYFTPV